MSDHVDGPRQIGDPPAISPICSRSPARKKLAIPLSPECLSLGRSHRDVLERGQSFDRRSAGSWPAVGNVRSSSQVTRSIASTVGSAYSNVELTRTGSARHLHLSRWQGCNLL